MRDDSSETYPLHLFFFSVDFVILDEGITVRQDLKGLFYETEGRIARYFLAFQIAKRKLFLS